HRVRRRRRGHRPRRRQVHESLRPATQPGPGRLGGVRVARVNGEEVATMEDKVALVTGAAGGIGAAVAGALGRRGARVAAVDRDAGRLAEVVGKLAADGLAVEAFPADVTHSGEVAALVDGVERALGPVEFLVNAAGVLRMSPVRHLADEDWTA